MDKVLRCMMYYLWIFKGKTPNFIHSLTLMSKKLLILSFYTEITEVPAGYFSQKYVIRHLLINSSLI